MDIRLEVLSPDDREQFIKDNQDAFNYGALEEFGLRDDHFEDDGQIISKETIEASIDGENAITYRIMQGNDKVGGVIIRTEKNVGELEILFVSPHIHSKGVGYKAWCEVERLHPDIKVWTTVTPYFEQRNIHFYVNRCGFKIVEFYNAHHPDPNDTDRVDELNDQFPDGMFKFEKRIDSEQIERIKRYEMMMNDALLLLEEKDFRYEERLKRLIQSLSDYYSSGEWRNDFRDDEAGRLPKDLKRGVLSEDGLYNLFERYKEEYDEQMF